MDKTGTLTRGEPGIIDIITEGIAADEPLRLVARVERESEHPLAEAIVGHADSRGLDAVRAERFESVPGHGAVAEGPGIG